MRESIKDVVLPALMMGLGYVIGSVRIHHYLTKFEEDGQKKAESWLQLDFFGKSYCFNTKRIDLD